MSCRDRFIPLVLLGLIISVCGCGKKPEAAKEANPQAPVASASANAPSKSPSPSSATPTDATATPATSTPAPVPANVAATAVATPASIPTVEGAAAAPVIVDDAAKGLKYKFKPGQTYIYSVTIVADLPDSTETSKGQIELAVKSADANEFHITPAANLPKEVKKKAAARPRAGPPGPGGPPAPPRVGPPQIAPPGRAVLREVTITPFGKMIRSSGDRSLPYLLGDASQLVIEPLSPDGAIRWDVANDVTIREIHESPFPVGGPFAPRNETNTTAKETVIYQLAAGKDSNVRIKKTYDLKMVSADNSAPRLQLQGTGDLDFDAQAGLLKSCEFKATLTLSERNVTVAVPLTVSYRLNAAQ